MTGHPTTLPVAELATLDQLAAVVHPVRRRVLAEIAEPASATEVAKRLSIKPQLANYHLRALAEVGLAREVELRQRRNLVERRYQALARSFVLSTALPLTEEQQRRLASSVTLQALVTSADEIRADALRLLDERDDAVAGAAIEIEVELGEQADRAAFVGALSAAIARAAEPYRGRSGSGLTAYRVRIAIHPRP
jgi:DNA-binding transcriptional ArsR family regulator